MMIISAKGNGRRSEEFTPLVNKRNKKPWFENWGFLFLQKKRACRRSGAVKWMVFVGIGEKSGRNEEDFSKMQGVKPLQMRNATVIMKK